MENLILEYRRNIQPLMDRIAQLDGEIAALPACKDRVALVNRRHGLWQMVLELQDDIRQMENREVMTMAQAFSKPFYNSRAWKRCQGSYIAQRKAVDGGMCQDCGEELGVEVHHEIPLTPENVRDPEVSLNHRRLRLLCRGCHARQHREPGEEADRYAFDGDGQVVPLPPSGKPGP